MFISSCQILNYKSFLRSPEIKLEPGFNIIVGQNDAGKTALLDILSLRFNNHPHRSLKTVPLPSSKYDNFSSCYITFGLAPNEARNLLERTGKFYVKSSSTANLTIGLNNFIGALKHDKQLYCYYHKGRFKSAYFKSYGENHPSHSIEVYSDPNEGGFRKNSDNFINLESYEDDDDFVIPDFYGPRIAEGLRHRIFKFNAERLNIKEALINADPTLAPDASNLAGVLNLLSTKDRDRFIEFEQAVTNIFPHITRIATPPDENAKATIEISTHDPSLKRSDLAIPLSECGTGISQVLAILYVVFAAQEPQTIIIDEPHSFLHPGAVRKLFETLKQHSQHQYIITTHFPTAITVTEPKTLLLVRRGEFESTIETINTSETSELRAFLREIGARLSDVFGADAILWVEGPTEEVCFPLLLQEIAKQPLQGVQILGVNSTGDFESKYTKTVFEIYERLCNGQGLLPPAVGFIFDREGRTKKAQEDLERQGKGKVSFLSRRMYENYLLNPNAISSVLQEEDSSGETSVTSEDVEQWLKTHGKEHQYFDSKEKPEVLSEEWFENVHAAHILEQLFADLSKARVQYKGRKVYYGKKLTEWLINNEPSALEELTSLVKAQVAH